MSDASKGFTPTGEDVERGVVACEPIWQHPEFEHTYGWGREQIRAVLATIGPIIERRERAAYEEGVQRGRRVVEDPTRFPIKNPDYALLRNEKRGES